MKISDSAHHVDGSGGSMETERVVVFKKALCHPYSAWWGTYLIELSKNWELYMNFVKNIKQNKTTRKQFNV
jgi:hypothetical protein